MAKDNQTYRSPKRWFLIDGIGALLSAFLLGIVLPHFQPFFDIPEDTLYFLAFWPCLFAAYDFICFFMLKQRIKVFLQTIAYVNWSYCLLSLIMAMTHFDTISIWGWAYIIGEISIVITLAAIELKVARQLQ